MEQVVVIGAGLGGTATAAFLGHAGVRALVIDARDGPSDRPRARVISARSQEMFRSLGLADRVVNLGRSGAYMVQVVDTVLGAPSGPPERDDTARWSPTGAALCDQDLVEAVLRDHATSLGARFAWGGAVAELVDRDDTVEVRLAGGPTIRASYVVLADGAHGPLHRTLEIEFAANGDFPEYDEALFRSVALDQLAASRPAAAFVCRTAGAKVIRRDVGRWTITRPGQLGVDVPTLVADAVGRPVDVHVLGRSRWRPSSQLAERFRRGRIFLIGDAAHAMPPAAGMAGNLAIADAHNVSWKLAAVLDGRAGAALLDSYEAERRPVAQLVLDESTNRMRGAPRVERATLQLGVGYPPGLSAALVGESTDVPVVAPAEDAPRVGVRVPHRWLADGRSTLDLTGGRHFVALGPVDAVTHPVPFHRVDLPGSGDSRVWLVRPDDHVAAHVRPTEAATTVHRLLSARSP